eukprot:Skav213745  [mRNA]  locus=scaffold19:181780:184728:- [translate_table: standard]
MRVSGGLAFDTCFDKMVENPAEDSTAVPKPAVGVARKGLDGQLFWLYLFVYGVYSGYRWSTNWKKDGHHSDFSALLGAVKTVGFAFIDLLALMALKASREAYAPLQALVREAPEVEASAKKCCCLGLLQAVAQLGALAEEIEEGQVAS